MGVQPRSVVIVGAGQAGCQAAASLRQLGYEGALTLVGDEPAPPYQRPPLSKAYLKGELEADRLWLRPIEFYAEQNIELLTGVGAKSIDLAAMKVELGSGARLPFDALVIATGARPRKLQLPGAQLDGVMDLRTLADVDKLKSRVVPGARMVVVGAGYIGLEAAAVAVKLGAQVTVLEAAPRVLGRVAGPEISRFYEQAHREAGVDLRTGVSIQGFEGTDRVRGVRLAGGVVVPCDLVLAGIGVHPNVEIAHAAGLLVGDGIHTDGQARTAHPDVYAIGDVARRPLVHYHRDGRLESVHNAIEGGKIAAAAILGQPAPVLETPWFWSDQYELKLQTAGLWTGADEMVVRGDPATRAFAVFYLKEGRILAVDAVNSGPEFIVGKKLAASASRVAPAVLADKSISMKDIGAKAVS
jgi:3-phenylpropionate/trans-cinnamate dioxygenase ferredoxin reductase subunit